MTDKARGILIVAALVIVFGGGAFYFFGIHQPAQERKAAQDEVARWEKRWQEARTCLLGPEPGSSKLAEALAIRELAPDPWERKTCTQAISSLARGNAEDTGMEKVERAWIDLEKAATKVANAFVAHVDPYGERPEKRKLDPLPGALDDLEAAYAKLRKAAGLPPSATNKGKPLPIATVVPLTLGETQLTSLQGPFMTSGAGFVGFGRAKDKEVQVVIAAGAPALIKQVGAGVQRAMPDSSWGAHAVPDGVNVGKIDDTGNPVSPTKLPFEEGPSVLAVVGTYDDGVVAFGGGTKLIVARGKGGTFTPSAPFEVIDIAYASDPLTGRTELVWTDGKAKVWRLALAPGQLDATPVELSASGRPVRACLDRDSLWVQMGDDYDSKVVEVTGDRVQEHDEEEAQDVIVGCTPDGALLRTNDVYKHCMAECNTFTPDGPPSYAMAVLPHGWVGFRTRGAVLAVHRASRTDYMAAPNSFWPVLSLTNGDVIDVLGYVPEGLTIVRVPSS